MSTKELQDQISATMKKWQKIENASVASTGNVIEKTDNPVVRQIMEIIQMDSQMHHRIQQLIIDSFERQALSLSGAVPAAFVHTLLHVLVFLRYFSIAPPGFHPDFSLDDDILLPIP